MNQVISGFSKLSKEEKILKLSDSFFNGDKKFSAELKKYWHDNESVQKTIDEFSENTISNFYFPFGVVPNVMINGEIYAVPMVIEESSVVAASARSANFWIKRGGFKAEVISTIKLGHVHFSFNGLSEKLFLFFKKIESILIEEVKPLTGNMEKRGGGLLSLSLIDCTNLEENYYKIEAEFETCDAMGANFINSVLEALGKKLKNEALIEPLFTETEKDLQVIMCILSNYTPKCLVTASVSCKIEDLEDESLGMPAKLFAEKFKKAVTISKVDITRATTHNKGIMNGVDAVVIATGNDFRAVEASVHTFACRTGKYCGLSDVEIDNDTFKFSLTLPLSLGSIGGLTSLHPMAKLSLDLLKRPNAKKLMEIVSVIGLAQNFAAIRSLVTSGIQKGHMKMHLMNILNHLEASELEREKVKKNFENEVISFSAVRDFLSKERNIQ